MNASAVIDGAKIERVRGEGFRLGLGLLVLLMVLGLLVMELLLACCWGCCCCGCRWCLWC